MGERIAFKSNGSTVDGYLAKPSARGPAVIVIQEWWGLVPHIEDVADRFAADPAVVSALDEQLTALGKRHEFHTYPNADHAFFNDTRPEVYDAAAAEDAWARTLAFFRRELPPLRAHGEG
jgi:dienelactone hydrolase